MASYATYLSLSLCVSLEPIHLSIYLSIYLTYIYIPFRLRNEPSPEIFLDHENLRLMLLTCIFSPTWTSPTGRRAGKQGLHPIHSILCHSMFTLTHSLDRSIYQYCKYSGKTYLSIHPSIHPSIYLFDINHLTYIHISDRQTDRQIECFVYLFLSYLFTERKEGRKERFVRLFSLSFIHLFIHSEWGRYVR